MAVKRKTIHLDSYCKYNWFRLVPKQYLPYTVQATLTTIDVYLFCNFWKIKTIKYMILELREYVIIRPEDYPLPKNKCVIKLPYGLYIETGKTVFKFINL